MPTASAPGEAVRSASSAAGGGEQARRFLVARPGRQQQRVGQSARGRHAEAGGAGEGEQLQQVIGGEARQPQPAADRPRVADQRHGAVADAPGGLLQTGRFRLAVGADPDRVAARPAGAPERPAGENARRRKRHGS